MITMWNSKGELLIDLYDIDKIEAWLYQGTRSNNIRVGNAIQIMKWLNEKILKHALSNPEGVFESNVMTITDNALLRDLNMTPSQVKEAKRLLREVGLIKHWKKVKNRYSGGFIDLYYVEPVQSEYSSLFLFDPHSHKFTKRDNIFTSYGDPETPDKVRATMELQDTAHQLLYNPIYEYLDEDDNDDDDNEGFSFPIYSEMAW